MGMRVECLYLKVLSDPAPKNSACCQQVEPKNMQSCLLYVIVFCACASLFYVL